MVRNVLLLAIALSCSRVAAQPSAPAPAAPPTPGRERAVLAGGCFWGIEAVFEHVKGVESARSGFAGGSRETASYRRISRGDTGHAEAVEVIFDPAKVSYAKLLQIFFTVHDPTQKDRQGPDRGPQYRSAIFFTTPEQERTARAYVAQLEKAGTYRAPVVTEIAPLPEFYPAEAHHQDYLERHRTQRYIVVNDLPKLDLLRERFPELWR